MASIEDIKIRDYETFANALPQDKKQELQGLLLTLHNSYVDQQANRTAAKAILYNNSLMNVTSKIESYISSAMSQAMDTTLTTDNRLFAAQGLEKLGKFLAKLGEAYPKIDSTIAAVEHQPLVQGPPNRGPVPINLKELGFDLQQKFTGNASVLHPALFLVKLEAFARLKQLSNPETAQVAAALCDPHSEAGEWISTLQSSRSSALEDYQKFKQLFTKRFRVKATLAQKADLQQSLKQKTDDTVLRFRDRCTNASYILFDDQPEDEEGKRKLNQSRQDWSNLQFVTGVLPPIRAHIVSTGADTTDAILEAACNAENSLKSSQPVDTVRFQGLELNSISSTSQAVKPDQETEIAAITTKDGHIFCFYCGEKGHTRAACPIRKKAETIKLANGVNPSSFENSPRWGAQMHRSRGGAQMFRGRGGPQGFGGFRARGAGQRPPPPFSRGRGLPSRGRGYQQPFQRRGYGPRPFQTRYGISALQEDTETREERPTEANPGEVSETDPFYDWYDYGYDTSFGLEDYELEELDYGQYYNHHDLDNIYSHFE